MGRRAVRSWRDYRDSSGSRLPGVTQITGVIDKKGLDEWRVKVAEESGRAELKKILKTGKDLGNAVHDMIVQAVAAGCTVKQCVCGAQENWLGDYEHGALGFLEDNVAEIIRQEKNLVHDRLGFGGTPDMYVRLYTGEFAVLDFKTNKSIYSDVRLQVAGYAILLHLNGYPVHQRIVVHLPRKNGYDRDDTPRDPHVHIYKNHYEDFQGFLAALRLYYWNMGAENGDFSRLNSIEAFLGDDAGGDT